jgi:HJR/Mrr/RecB family endonuclease
MFHVYSGLYLGQNQPNRISSAVLTASRSKRADDPDDDEIMLETAQQAGEFERLESIRGKLLSLDTREFELFIKGLLQHCGFANVYATKFSADGGVDVNAKAGTAMWAIANTVVQVQAKRWLHSVGRKEVAELRGSLQPFARGAVVTTSHFSKAAIDEGREEGNNPTRVWARRSRIYCGTGKG